MSDEKIKFWMVWSPQGRAPTYRHRCRVAAEREAERLAGSYSGGQFFVLKAVVGFAAEKPKVSKIRLVKPAKGEPEIPF